MFVLVRKPGTAKSGAFTPRPKKKIELDFGKTLLENQISGRAAESEPYFGFPHYLFGECIATHTIFFSDRGHVPF